MKKLVIAGACLIGALAFMVSCSSSSTSSTPTLESVSDLPSVDASNYDYSLNSAVQGLSKLAPRALGNVGQVGGFSRAACEGYTLKKQLFQDAREIDSFLCYIKSMESEMGMTIPADAWSYFEINFPEVEGMEEQGGPPPNVRVRIGMFDSQLKMDVCIPDQTDAYQREVEVRFSATETGYSGYVVNEYSFTDPMEQKSFTGNSKIEVAIVGTSADDFTSAEFTAYHRDNDGSGNGWQSQMGFTADDATKTNTLSGANAYSSTDWGDNTGRLLGQWGEDLVGSVQFNVTGEYNPPDAEKCLAWGVPAEFVAYCADKCFNEQGQETPVNENGNCEFTHSGTESFSIDVATTPPSFAIVDDASSSYFEAVSAATLPTLDDIESNVAFVEAWDCTSEAGFTTVDATAMRDLKDNCAPERDEEMWRLCEQQQRAEEGQE